MGPSPISKRLGALLIGIGCLGAWTLHALGDPVFPVISEEQEVAAGRRIARQVERRFKSVKDPAMQDRVDTIGKRLAVVSDRPGLLFRFEVLDEEGFNAFTLPGGYVYIFRSLVERLTADDQVAAILAHEIGHVAAFHFQRRLQQGLGLTILQALVGQSRSTPATKQRIFAGLNELMLSFSREDELEADRLGVKYMRSAGYRPEAAIEVIELLKAHIFTEEPIRRLSMRSHPYLDERLRTIREVLTGSISFEDYINTPPQAAP